jgi:hypothetical protein
MDLSIFETLGWRDAIMAAVFVSAVYMLLTVLRLLQVRRHAPSRDAAISKQEPLRDEPLLGDAVTVAPEFLALLPASSRKPAPSSTVRNVPQLQKVIEPVVYARRPEPELVKPQQHSAVDAELQVLRGDLARLSNRVAEAREEIELLKASRNVSPLYSEAMGLAQQGHDARSIAGRCGISIGEAELVAALSRKEQGFAADEKVEDESEDNDGRASADDPRR